MIELFALLVPQNEDLILIIKYCQGLERESWEWILKLCWMYDPAPAPNAVIAGASAGLALIAAKLLRLFVSAR